MQKEFKDICVGDIVVCDNTPDHDYETYIMKITSVERDEEWITEDNPEGIVAYGEGYTEEENDYIENAGYTFQCSIGNFVCFYRRIIAVGVKLRDGLSPEILRKYGFKTGKEWFEAGERCFSENDYQSGWYHKFLLDEDTGRILYTDEEYDIPVVQISCRAEEKYGFDFYVDAAPSCTYHVGGEELDVVLDTIYQLAVDKVTELKQERSS